MKKVLSKIKRVARGTAKNIASSAREQLGKPLKGIKKAYKNLPENIRGLSKY